MTFIILLRISTFEINTNNCNIILESQSNLTKLILSSFFTIVLMKLIQKAAREATNIELQKHKHMHTFDLSFIPKQTLKRKPSKKAAYFYVL